MVRKFLWAIAVVALFGCAVEAGPVAESPQAPIGASAELQAPITIDHEAVLRFLPDGSVTTDNAPIFAGGRVKIVYDLQRLPQCRATKYGMPAWATLAYVQWDGGAVQTMALTSSGNALQPVLQVPETAKKLQLWFYNNDYYGCKAWDSQGGTNYSFAIAPPAAPVALRFKADATQSQDAPLQQGGIARIVYAAQRLPACRLTVGGMRAWNLYAGWRFLPGGQTGGAALLSANAAENSLLEPLVPIPQGAAAMELWFSNSDSSGCAAWDSNLSKNYSFAVLAAKGLQVGWAGDFDFRLVSKSVQSKGNVDPAYYFDSMEGMPLSTFVEVQAWIPGLSDQPYASKEAAASAAKAIKAELFTDAVKDAKGGWSGLPLTFERQQGNNLVWSFRLGDLRWPQFGFQVADGLYHYTMRFSADAGATWYEAGKESGQARRMVFAKTQDCKLFPDNAPADCPKNLPVQWAGNWGGYFTHACTLKAGLSDPVLFTKSALGHDCMMVAAEVYVPGVTDKDAKPGAVLAQVETDIGYGGGPLATAANYPLGFDGKVGNNFRFVWNTAQLVGMASKGDYKFRMRFSADGGTSWYVLGKGNAGALAGDPKVPEPGWRNLWVRNDSTDIGEVKYCDGLGQWDGPSNSWPTCITWQPAVQKDAVSCEFYVNSIGRGSFSHNGTFMKWLEVYLPVAAPQGGAGQVLGAGMWVRYFDQAGKKQEQWLLGKQIEPGYWRSGFTYERGGPGSPAFKYSVDAFAFFADVAAASGAVTRYWQSAGGQNYTQASVWTKQGFMLGIGSGSIEYADESEAIFGVKQGCKK